MYPQVSRMRFRPVEEVIAEVAAIPDRGIVFWDDNLGANPRYAKDLFRGLIPLERWWTSQTTMASVKDDEVLELAARSGCKALFLGLESISQASLASAAKSHNRVREYKRLLQRLHGYGIAVQAGLMFGFDEDTPDIFRQTVDVMGDVGLDNATISLMVPYPRTPVYARLRAEGRLIDLSRGQKTQDRRTVRHDDSRSALESGSSITWASETSIPRTRATACWPQSWSRLAMPSLGRRSRA